ncbi:MAG: cation diffusion facilitator family transporter [Thermodesulfovibrionales bacterium]|nr:cation diffusion facilitator family transporter [Thermodesulfovibrionales bacterium]
MKYPECARCGRLSPRLSVVGNFFMAVFKFIVGALAGSKGLVADALHSIADMISSIFVLVALKYAEKPRDKRYPYGYGKVEYVSTIVASLFIFLCGLTVFIDALESLKSGVHKSPDITAIFATILSLCFSYVMYSSNTCAGTQLNSPAMLADAAESKADSLTSVAVLFGLIGTKLGFESADTIAAIIVSIFIFRIGLEMLMGGINGLMDMSLDPEKIEEIRNVCLSINGVEGVRNINARQFGQKSRINVDIEILKERTVIETHQIANRVKSTLITRLDGISDVFVTPVPVERIGILGFKKR